MNAGNSERQKELDGADCLALRPLWEEVFSEDSKEFTDYYFAEKAVHNHGFVLEAEGKNRAMLYLSPYEMMIRAGKHFLTTEINYIVGVATKKEYRHRGYMDRLLKASLQWMDEKKQPFTFLMPASPKIYAPYQFVYIYDRKEYLFGSSAGEMKAAELGKPSGKIRAAKPSDYIRLSAYASEYLADTKDVFMRRDEAYYAVLAKELEAQNGGIYLLTGQNGTMDGYFLYTEEEGKGAVQEMLPEKPGQSSPVVLTEKRTPVIMARIVNLQVMLEMMRTKNGSFVLYFRITDPILSENSGIWEWKVSEKTSFARKVSGNHLEEAEWKECGTGIDRFTSWVFGYKKAKDCFSFGKSTDGRGKQDILCKLERVAVLGRVFLNEIV